MSDWQDLCDTMNLDNDENALDQMVDQFIQDDLQAGSAFGDSTKRNQAKSTDSNSESDEAPI
ncbi:MAG: hypothetical protein NWQ54_22000 [Paraglaciecola sp.]|nr:hypothetical protein [Paraglaciecola sp.]